MLSSKTALIKQRLKSSPISALTALTLLIFALVLLPEILLPLGNDQGIFAYVADQMLQGHPPYRDTFDVKWPATYFVYAMGISVFGHTELGVRLFFLCLFTASAYFAGQIAENIAAGRARLITLLCFLGAGGPTLIVDGGVYTGVPGGQSEDIQSLFLLWAVALLSRAQRDIKSLIGAGFLLITSILVKPTVLPAVVLILLVLLFKLKANALKWVLSGGTLSVIGTTLYLLVSGSFSAFIEVGVFHVLSYQSMTRDLSIQFFVLFLSQPIYSGLFLIAIVMMVLRERSSVARDSTIALFAGTLLAYFWQQKGFNYHLVPFTQAAAIVIGVFISRLTDLIQRPALRLIAVALSLLLANAHTTEARAHYWSDFFGYCQGNRTLSEVRGFHPVSGNFSYDEAETIASYIEEHSEKHDYIYIWGQHARILFLTERDSPSKFTTNATLLIYGPKKSAAFKRELLEELNERPPKFIIISPDKSFFLRKADSQEITDFPEFNHYLEKNYPVELVFDKFTIRKKAESDQ